MFHVGEDDVLQPHLGHLPGRIEDRTVHPNEKARLSSRLGRLDDREAGFDLGQAPARTDQCAMLGEHLVDVAAELGPRSGEKDQVVTDPLEVVQQVRRHDDRKTPIGHRRGERRQELATSQRVQRGHRLVEQQELGPLRQDQAQADLGPLTAREGGDRSVRRDPQCGQSCPSCSGIPVAIEVRADLQMVFGAEALVEGHVLGEVSDAGQELLALLGNSAEHLRFTRAGGAQPDEELQQRRLPRPVRPDQRRDMTGRHRHRAVLQRPVGAVALAQPGRVDCRYVAVFTLSSPR